MTPSQYQRLFKQRGLSYASAMRQYPEARDQEFRELLAHIDAQEAIKVADIPSGEGYLSRFLPNSFIDQLEPCKEFGANIAHGQQVDLERVQLKAEHYNLVVSMAAMHHVDNKQGFFQAAYDALKPGGYFCVGDVVAGSDIAHFLDHFTGKYNGTGHQGDYLDAPLIEKLSDIAGFKTIDLSLRKCPWQFATTEDMTDFCCRLFGLRNVQPDTVLTALANYVGIVSTTSGVSLEWELLYTTQHKPLQAVPHDD